MGTVTFAHRHRQRGFTLIEIALVLVILGLLIGGIVKGQVAINAARVRSLVDTTQGIQAAYHGFFDRYHRVPGDWNATSATDAIGASVSTGGNDNGRLDVSSATDFTENNALWEQLSRSAFLDGSYPGGIGEPDLNNGRAPLNTFNRPILMGYTDAYLEFGSPAPPPKLVTTVGRGVPVHVMRELDMKLDDGNPGTGALRATVPDTTSVNYFDGVHKWSTSGPGCVTTVGGQLMWDVAGASQDCNAVYSQ